jgi:glycopeptide antibiotics resistance protein
MLNSNMSGTKSTVRIMTTEDLPLQQTCLRWSNRILILSLLGICYLTLFPFQIHFAHPHPFHGSPFFLGNSVKTLRHTDFFLNVLLFVPFGFGLATEVRKRGGTLWTAGMVALLVGACTTYSVELLQLYIPGRDSGWEDVVSNTMGSVVGFLLFAFVGRAFLTTVSGYADSFEEWITPRSMEILLSIYFAACFGAAVRMQMQTRLSNWDPQCVLNVGNDAAGQNPWMGRVSRLQIWSRAIPEQSIRLQRLTSLSGPKKWRACPRLGSGGATIHECRDDRIEFRVLAA